MLTVLAGFGLTLSRALEESSVFKILVRYAKVLSD